MTHQFMYPAVHPVPGTAPRTDSGDPARAVDARNDTVDGPSSRAHEEQRSGPPVGREGPLRSAPRPAARDRDAATADSILSQ